MQSLSPSFYGSHELISYNMEIMKSFHPTVLFYNCTHCHPSMRLSRLSKPFQILIYSELYSVYDILISNDFFLPILLKSSLIWSYSINGISKTFPIYQNTHTRIFSSTINSFSSSIISNLLVNLNPLMLILYHLI